MKKSIAFNCLPNIKYLSIYTLKNMSNKRKIPIKRINKFFSGRDFDLEVQMGREAMEGDGNFTVILYRVDRVTTQVDDLYGEASADEINYLAPVELYVVPIIAKAENMTYSKGHMRQQEDGNLTFILYVEHLNELGVDITMGDYVAYPINETDVVYYSVSDAGEKNYDNAHTIMGYKGAYRIITCTWANEDEFKGI
jgi:hypothetical protein